MKFKITFKEDTKVVSTLKCFKDLVDYTQRVLAAENQIQGSEQLHLPVKYLYIDEDNEQITISNENDFTEALTTVQGRNYLKIIVQEVKASSQQQVHVAQNSNLLQKNMDALYEPASMDMANVKQERKKSIPFEVIESQMKQSEQSLADDQQQQSVKFDLQKSLSDWIKAEVQKEMNSAREQMRNSQCQQQQQQQHLINSSAVMVPQLNDSQVNGDYSCDQRIINPIQGQLESESSHSRSNSFQQIKMNDQQLSAIRSQRESFVKLDMEPVQTIEDYSIEWENFGNNYTVEVSQKFTKFWRIKNISTITWFANQYSVFPADKETEQAGFSKFHLLIDVPPQKTIPIGLDFQAPRDPKTCKYSFCLKFDGQNVMDMRGTNLVCEFRAMVMPSDISQSRILQDMMHVSNSTMMTSKMLNYPQQHNHEEMQNQFMNLMPPQIVNEKFHEVKDINQKVQQLNLDPKPAQDIIIEKQSDIIFNLNQNVAEVCQPEPMKQSVLSPDELKAVEYSSKVDTVVKNIQHKECMLNLLTMGFTDFDRNYDLVKSENGRMNYVVHYLSEAQ